MQKYAKTEKMEKMRVFYEIEKVENIHIEKIHSYSLEKDFVCSECGKEFVFCSSLKDHLKTHMKV